MSKFKRIIKIIIEIIKILIPLTGTGIKNISAKIREIKELP